MVATRNYIPQTWKDIGRFCSVIKEHIAACNFSFMKGGCFHNAHMIENIMDTLPHFFFPHPNGTYAQAYFRSHKPTKPYVSSSKITKKKIFRPPNSAISLAVTFFCTLTHESVFNILHIFIH